VASIVKRGDRWRALVRRTGHRAICRTFRTRAEAAEWARGVEAQLDAGRAVAVATRATVAAVIAEYRKLRDRARPIADTSNEHYQLRALERLLGPEVAAGLTVERLVDWATQRKDEGAGPYTLNMELGKLGTVFRYAASGLPDVVGQARPKLAYLGLIGGGGRRERRPVEDELARILAWLDEHRGRRYADVTAFAAISAMRRGECCEIRWADLDERKRLVGAWRKHPRKGKVWEQVPLLGEAWDIVIRQPRDDERIFPTHPQTLSKYFREACAALGIPDLHLHDLRHEGTSRLFEQGFSIEQVALVTGHQDWRNLRRYANLKPESLTRAPDPDTPRRP
jgi:integrase